MFEHDFEKIDSTVSKHSENLIGFRFSAKKLAENPKKLAGFKPGMLAPPRPVEKRAAPPRPAEINKTRGAQRGKANCRFQD